MLPGLRRQRATLSSKMLVHAGDLLLDPGNRLRQSGHLLPQGLAPGLRLLGSLERLRWGHIGATPHRASLAGAGRRHGHPDRIQALPRPIPDSTEQTTAKLILSG